MHNTTTAMPEIQEKICEELDKGRFCLVYSVDLSTAFDLFRRDTFYHSLKTIIDPDTYYALDHGFPNR